MKTGLGLNFLRVVNEEGFDGWAQVYARIPFEEEEILRKGALFGAIYSEDLTDWTSKEAEIMTWVDEFFNSTESVGDLTKIDEFLDDKYPGLGSVWIWISIVGGGKRELRMIKTGNVGMWLLRDGDKNNLGKQVMDRKVLKGSVFDEDKIVIWAGDIESLLSKPETIDTQKTVADIGDELMKNNRAGASLIFTFSENESVGEQEVEEVASPVVEIQQPKEEKNVFFESNETPEVVVEENNELVSDRYVGQVGPKEKLINWWKNKGFKNRNSISIGREVSKRKKISMGLGLLFLALLIVSIVSGSLKIKSDNEQKKWNQFYEPIEKKRVEALGLTGVNLVGSRKLMEEVKADFDAGKGQFVNTKYKNQLSEFENKINSSWSTALGEKQSSFGDQVNIGLIREGFQGSRLSLISKKLFLVLDEKMGLVVSADGTSKDIKVLGGKGENLGWMDIVYDGKRNLILDSTGVGVVESGKKLASFDGAVGKAVALGVFGGNVYVLDQVNKELYRYSSGTDTLGDRNRWLKQDQVINRQPLDMAIDGDIWVIEEGNLLERFRRGVKENFSLNGVPDKAAFVKVAVEEDGDRIALLDSKNGSVSIFKKEDGAFVEQLRQDSLKQATDLVFDDENNLWVLVGGMIGVLK